MQKILYTDRQVAFRHESMLKLWYVQAASCSHFKLQMKITIELAENTFTLPYDYIRDSFKKKSCLFWYQGSMIYWHCHQQLLKRGKRTLQSIHVCNLFLASVEISRLSMTSTQCIVSIENSSLQSQSDPLYTHAITYASCWVNLEQLTCQYLFMF